LDLIPCLGTGLPFVHGPAVDRSPHRLGAGGLAGDEALAARVQHLADAETSCCSFFTFTLTPLDTDQTGATDRAVVALDIGVPAARSDVLAALIQRADRARRAAS
jgi:hypothetical protein